MSDALLRLSKKRYQTDIKFHKDMKFNMIRCWAGGIAERPEFYHYCDVYGLLVSFYNFVPVAAAILFLPSVYICIYNKSLCARDDYNY